MRKTVIEYPGVFWCAPLFSCARVSLEPGGDWAMEHIDETRILEMLITYFETGNIETDKAAKAILSSEGDASAYWYREGKRIMAGVEWTGLRGVEAEILASALRRIQTSLPR